MSTSAVTSTSSAKDILLAELTSSVLTPHLRAAFHDTSAAEDLSPEDRERLEARYARTFASFLERGFDVVFRGEILGQREQESPEEARQAANVTVTEEDLLELDLALQGAAARRKQYPPRLSLYLDKILQHRSESAASARTELRAQRGLETEEEQDFPEREDLAQPSLAVSGEQQQEALLVQYKEQVERAKRILTSAKTLLEMSTDADC